VGSVESDAFSGVVVETIDGEFDVIPGDGFKAHLLREELTNEPVDFLVGAAFARGT
jgi:hypothetical protein